MEHREVLVGLDVGTTSVKALVLTPDGDELAVGRAPTVWRETPDGVEADADEIARAAEQALADALGAVPGARALAVGVASMAESGVLVDDDDRPLAPVIAWHDARDAALLEQLVREVGGARFSTRTGLPLWTQWSLTKHRWLAEHHEPARRAVRRHNVAEWVVRRLGGDAATELSLASRTGWLDLASGQPWDETLEWSRAPRGVLGELRTAGSSWVGSPATTASARPAGDPHRRRPRPPGGGRRGGRPPVPVTSSTPAARPRPSCAPSPPACPRRPWPVSPRPASPSGGTPCATAGASSAPPRGAWCCRRSCRTSASAATDLAQLDAAALAATPGAAHLEVSDDGHAVTATGSRAPADRWRAATRPSPTRRPGSASRSAPPPGPGPGLVVAGGWSHSTPSWRPRRRRSVPYPHHGDRGRGPRSSPAGRAGPRHLRLRRRPPRRPHAPHALATPCLTPTPPTPPHLVSPEGSSYAPGHHRLARAPRPGGRARGRRLQRHHPRARRGHRRRAPRGPGPRSSCRSARTRSATTPVGSARSPPPCARSRRSPTPPSRCTSTTSRTSTCCAGPPTSGPAR